MSPQALFAVANAIAMVAWGLLVVAPRQRWSSRVASLIVPALLAIAYVVVLATHWSIEADSFSTLEHVAALFENRWALLAGWIHYLAFDLLIGVSVSRDAASRGIPHLLVVPCLILTFLFGPAGWLSYQAVKGARVRRIEGARVGA